MLNLVLQKFSGSCSLVSVVCDRYDHKDSIKSEERARRSRSLMQEIQVRNRMIPIPKQRRRFLSHCKNKENLANFLFEYWCQEAARRLRADHVLQLAGGFRDGEKTVSISQGRINYIEELRSDHEEADSRMFVHLKYAYNLNTVERYIIGSPDTDIAVLGIHFAEKFWLKKVHLRTGIKRKKRFIPIHKIFNQLSTTMCQFLPAVHALIGCDSFSAHSKKSAFKVLQEANGLCEESNISLNLSHVSNYAFVSCKRFVCRVYDSKTSTEDLNVLRYSMFTKSHTSSDKLPPTEDSLKQHIMRADYQS